MRSIWKGAVTFGLVNVPVKLYSATEDHDIALHQVHDKDGGRIRYQRRCEICGKVVEYEHIDKAYDNGEQTVVLSSEDLATLPVERSREIEVVEFVPDSQLDPVMFDRSYYLEPDSKSPKAYALLRRTLEDTDRTAIVTFSLRQKTRLGALRVRGKVLMLQSLLWNDEVREAEFPSLDETVRISSKERDMSAALVEQFSGNFEPDAFTDDYQAQLRKLIDEKLEHGETVDTEATFGESPEENDGGGEVVDLMEALKRSLERNKKRTGDKSSSTASTAGAGKATAAKSASTKTSAAKSGTAKSGTAKATKSATAKATASRAASKAAPAKTKRAAT